ncbi:MAG: hypothetical protein JXQ96_03810 [Cyclobacteriaceae bacterium]
MTKYSITILLLFLLGTSVQGQVYSLKIDESETAFGSIKQKAFNTRFSLPYDYVKKEWWRYIKRYAIRTNKRIYYENRIPAKKSQSATDIYFYSYIDKGENHSTLYVSLNPNDAGKTNVVLYRTYLKDLMLDFKVYFYTKYIQGKINEVGKKSERTSTKVEKLEKSIAKLNSSKKKKNANPRSIDKKIASNEKEIEKLRLELFAYQKNTQTLKGELKKIK